MFPNSRLILASDFNTLDGFLDKIGSSALDKIETKSTPKYRTHNPKVQNPQPLVGKQVVHYFEEDGTHKGYPGLVTGLVSGTTMWFNISYDDDVQEFYNFELPENYREGDLEILFTLKLLEPFTA